MTQNKLVWKGLSDEFKIRALRSVLGGNFRGDAMGKDKFYSQKGRSNVSMQQYRLRHYRKPAKIQRFLSEFKRKISSITE